MESKDVHVLLSCSRSSKAKKKAAKRKARRAEKERFTTQETRTASDETTVAACNAAFPGKRKSATPAIKKQENGVIDDGFRESHSRSCTKIEHSIDGEMSMGSEVALLQSSKDNHRLVTTNVDRSSARRGDEDTVTDVEVEISSRNYRERLKKRRIHGKRGTRVENHGEVVDTTTRERTGAAVFERWEEASLTMTLELMRRKHRNEIGQGMPLVGVNISDFAEFGIRNLVNSLPACPAERQHTNRESIHTDDAEATANATDAITDIAGERYAGQVTISQFETLFRKEVSEYPTKRHAARLLRQALEAEQIGDLDAAEAECAACLDIWPGCGRAHLKIAQILRAGGISEQRAIRDVEHHLRQTMTCACKLQGGYSGRAEAMGKDAAERLALLLCQEGRDKEAAKILKNHGFRYRLSRRVLRYQLSRAQPLSLLAAQDASREQHTVKSSERSCLPSEDLAFEAADGRGARMVEEASEFVVAVDSALPVVMLQHLQEAFGSSSCFWSEHGYNSETGTPGYFSYVHRLGKAPATSIEQIIDHLRDLAERSFPEVKEAKFVEWWAHRRPHSSGHQMHFDSDNEGIGGVRNPIISLVVYVTGDVGGPTLVTTQRLNSKRLAERGWVVHPRENRVCMFDGGVLHGVIPGRGIPSSVSSSSRPSLPQPLPAMQTAPKDGRKHKPCDGAEGPTSRKASAASLESSGEKARKKKRERAMEQDPPERAGMRVTWMVAFWRDIQARPALPRDPSPGSPPCGAGAAQPFPGEDCQHAGQEIPEARKSSGCTWPTLFTKKPVGWARREGWSGGIPVVPVSIPQVWEDVDVAENRRLRATVRRLKRLPEYDTCFQGF